jgi:hypothetical protein
MWSISSFFVYALIRSGVLFSPAAVFLLLISSAAMSSDRDSHSRQLLPLVATTFYQFCSLSSFLQPKEHGRDWYFGFLTALFVILVLRWILYRVWSRLESWLARSVFRASLPERCISHPLPSFLTLEKLSWVTRFCGAHRSPRKDFNFPRVPLQFLRKDSFVFWWELVRSGPAPMIPAQN